MQGTGDIRRRDNDHKRLHVRIVPWQVRVICRLEIALLFPNPVDFLFILSKVIRFRQFSHPTPLDP